MKKFQVLHWASMSIGALSILLPILFWNQIPAKIPMHYNGEGAVDAWAEKPFLILLFFVIAMLMGMMSIVLYVLKCNLRSVYTKEIEKSQTQVVYPFIVLLNLILQLMFAYIVFCTVCAKHLGKAFLPLVLGIVGCILGVMIWKTTQISARSDTNRKWREQEEKRNIAAIYRTKIDLWLLLVLVGTEVFLVVLVLEPLWKNGSIKWIPLLTFVGVSVLIFPLFGIRYVLYEEHLLVCASPYGKVRIRYKDIQHMKETMNPISSAAMSIHRIQIEYVEEGIHRMILVSPKNRKEFIKEIEAKRIRQ